jgi:ankyrin repeat domain-containing protein 50
MRYSEPLTTRDILESLVKQIVERHADLVPTVETLYVKHRRERTRPSQQDLLRLLSQFTELGKRLFFVLDALDELPSEERAIILTLLASLDAKLFITSRPLPPLQQCFPGAKIFEVAAHAADIDLLIQEYLLRNPDLKVLFQESNLEDHFKQKIRQKSGKM